MVASHKRQPSLSMQLQDRTRGTPGLDHSDGMTKDFYSDTRPAGMATFPRLEEMKKLHPFNLNNFTLPAKNKPVDTIENSKRNKTVLSKKDENVKKQLIKAFQLLESSGNLSRRRSRSDTPGFFTPRPMEEEIKTVRNTNLKKRIDLQRSRYRDRGWPPQNSDTIKEELRFEEERLKLKYELEEKEAKHLENIENEMENLKRQLAVKSQLLVDMEMQRKIEQVENAEALDAALKAAADATAAAQSAAESAKAAIADAAGRSPPEGARQKGSDESDESDGDESDEKKPKTPHFDPKVKNSKDEMRTIKDQIYIMEKTRPDVGRCSAQVKIMIQKGLKLVGKENWPDIQDHLLVLQDSERWPSYLLDLDAPVWDPDAKEDPLEAKLRKEMYIILRDVIDKKHYAKIKNVQNSGDKHNGQALYRVLNDYFAVGKRDGDVLGAGIAMRNCTMGSTSLNVVDYGIELVSREKVLKDIGIPSNEKLELIPLYLKGLSKSFDSIRMTIDNEMEADEEKDWTLNEIMKRVERKAVKYNLTGITAQAKVSQNVQDTAKGTTGKVSKATKKKNKQKKKLEALQQQVKQLQASATSSTDKSKTSTAMCVHGDKCWLTDCKYKHKPGHKPATNPKNYTCATCGKKGHKSSECGKCYRCGDPNHIASACPEKGRAEGQKAAPFQGAQVAEVDDEERPVMLRL